MRERGQTLDNGYLSIEQLHGEAQALQHISPTEMLCSEKNFSATHKGRFDQWETTAHGCSITI